MKRLLVCFISSVLAFSCSGMTAFASAVPAGTAGLRIVSREEFDEALERSYAVGQTLEQAQYDNYFMCTNLHFEEETVLISYPDLPESSYPETAMRMKTIITCFPQDYAVLDAAYTAAQLPDDSYALEMFDTDDEELYQTGKLLAGYCDVLNDAFEEEEHGGLAISYIPTIGQIAIESSVRMIGEYSLPLIQAFAEQNGLRTDLFTVNISPLHQKVRFKGDADNDNQITALDAQLVLQTAAEQLVGNQVSFKTNTDLDGDGEITPLDAQYILTYCLRNTVLNEQILWRDLISEN